MAAFVKYRSDFHHNAYVLNIALIAMSLPLSKFTMSIFEFSLLFLWILDGFSFRIAFRFFKLGGFFTGIGHTFAYSTRLIRYNFIEKFRVFFRNKPAVVLASIYFMHLIGVLWTSNFDYALKDLRIKLPLLLFPVVFAGMSKISAAEFRKVLYGYMSAIVAGIMISLYLYFEGEYLDVRDLSPFISPIRFSLNVSFGFFILAYFVFIDKYYHPEHRLFFIMLMGLFIFFLMILESITGLSIIVATAILLLFVQLMLTDYTKLKIAISVLMILIPVSLFYYIRNVVVEATTPPPVDITQLKKKTDRGHPYTHDLSQGIEDGKYVGLYLCEQELRDEWNKRSKLDYDGQTLNGEPLDKTLIRYLTSKNLLKDASGIDSLSSWDMSMIENGIANINYVKNPGLRTRILKIIFGFQVYQKNGDPSGSSIMQRYEYSKAALKLISKHWLTGVGTGDLEDALYRQYKEMNSKLKKEFIFHAHNQYLAILIAFGVFGLLWFLFALIYPPYRTGYFRDYFFLSFFVIIMLSMLSDDTLETQAGATLFAFFYSFLLFGRKPEKTLYLSKKISKR